MEIPKIIHQVWEGRTEPKMPVRLQILAETWKEKNPDWEYHLWNGDEMDELVSTHFPYFLSTYNSFSYNVQRWDAIRYMLLYVHGGVYTDLDTECFRSIDALCEKKNMLFGKEPPEHNFYSGVPSLIGNAFMASEKGFIGWLDILNEISESMSMNYLNQTVLQTTGPLMISRMFPILKKKYNAQYISHEQVTPVTKKDMCQYILQGKKESFYMKVQDAYCAHYFFCSWEPRFSIY